MATIVILLVFGLAFAGFALLGPAERARACEHGSVGDPKCEHCPLEKDGFPFEELGDVSVDGGPGVS